MMQTKITLFLVGLLLLSSCKLKTTDGSKSDQKFIDEEYQLVWSDEFDYSGLPDSTKWIYDTEGNDAGWGNQEAQYYTVAKKENAWVENGVLNITALKEQVKGKEYTSARLNSKETWLHGRIEVRAKLPKGRGTWSAIWMMPKDWTFNDGGWPRIGEIDIMEHVGHNLGTIHASAHSKDYQWQKDTQQTNTIQLPNVDEKFHSYILEWTPEIMKAYVDDQLYFEYKNEGLGLSKWPYIKPFYLILNLAVGGAWGGVEGIDDSAFPQTMEIDYVRIYQKK
ncbi:glycoside hydrolase family 16 protein [Marinifilum sp. RC60d5]|uniref:glycoside hydrolase family 16 protein n=1 Tax=Marinifilum sp. RC60d5 TaxID=3458414 RepID=UPI004036C388